MKDKEPLSFRIEPALHQRLEECARRLRLKKYTLGLLAIEAAVEAVEKNDYKLVVPIQFDVAQVPTQVRPAEAIQKGGVRYPEHRTEVALAEDGTRKPGATGKVSSSKGSGRKLASDILKKIAPDHPKGQPPD